MATDAPRVRREYACNRLRRSYRSPRRGLPATGDHGALAPPARTIRSTVNGRRFTEPPEGCHVSDTGCDLRRCRAGRLAVVVVRTVALMIVRRLVGALGCGRATDADAVEIAVLRHELAVLRRQVPRPRFTLTDRMLLATLARRLPREPWPVFLVTPASMAPGRSQQGRHGHLHHSSSSHDAVPGSRRGGPVRAGPSLEQHPTSRPPSQLGRNRRCKVYRPHLRNPTHQPSRARRRAGWQPRSFVWRVGACWRSWRASSSSHGRLGHSLTPRSWS
jgi:hypothetical protein